MRPVWRRQHIMRDMTTVRAIFENGVFRPTDPVELPERCEVEFEPRPVQQAMGLEQLDPIYEVLRQRHRSGERDVAERHNEHQP